MSPPKKPRACIPCQKRKVRCDASQVGTPCSRCTHKACEEACVPSARTRRRIEKTPRRQRGSMLDVFITKFEAWAQGKPASRFSEEPTASGEPAAPGESIVPEESTTPSHLSISSDEDETSIREDSEQLASNNTIPSLSEDLAYGCLTPRRFVVEYYKEFNPCTMVADSLDHPRRRGLVHTEDPLTTFRSLQQRELSGLDSLDRSYLLQRRVHDISLEGPWLRLVHFFLRDISIHIPIIDSQRFMSDFKRGTCPSMLLYAVLINALPSVPDEHIQGMGYTSRLAAQTEFFTRAKILYDFGCEKNELNLLQSCILLGSYPHSLDSDKGSRYWFNNAVRLALQMGLHKSATEREIDSTTYTVCRRIWWFLKHRDVFSVIVGLESTQKLIEEDADTSAITVGNYCDDASYNTPFYIPNLIERLYFIELCKLSRIGSTFLHLFRPAHSLPTVEEAMQFHKAMEDWRSSLPLELRPDLTNDLDSTSMSCIVVLHITSFQVEVMFYRTIRTRKVVSGTDIDRVLDKAVMEATSLFRKAVTLNITKHIPPFLNEFLAQLAAVQIETIQTSSITHGSNGSARAVSLHADLYVFLAHFEEFEKRWPSATKYSRLFRKCLKV
ncbi:hypothetical protein DM02DRAFT_668961 [Periconia macrospinosa]|uniref:Zn(2)-C6 fungal-type domain-containing protein n=1 Tax=Periconia macrospinosa TaxID=97972 RepID=A0A2V1E1T8_9PLEO|nr:hypothetical protein DM02DRAFT_668961 [Periconia macrospinosa]